MNTEDIQGDDALRSWLKADISIEGHEFEKGIMDKLILLSAAKEKKRKAASRVNNFIIIGFCLLTVIVFGLSFTDKTVFVCFKLSYAHWRPVSEYEYPDYLYYSMLMTSASLSVIFLMLHRVVSKRYITVQFHKNS